MPVRHMMLVTIVSGKNVSETNAVLKNVTWDRWLWANNIETHVASGTNVSETYVAYDKCQWDKCLWDICCMGRKTIRQILLWQMSVWQILVFINGIWDRGLWRKRATCYRCSSEKWRVWQMSVRHMLHRKNVNRINAIGTKLTSQFQG
jgi:hypothetical protein